MRHASMTAFALALVSPLAAAAPTVEEFTAFPKNDNLVISPSGKYLAGTHREGENHLLTIVEFPSMKTYRGFSFGNQTDVENIHWVDDKRLLIQPARLLPFESDAKLLTGEIARADLDTGRASLIYGFVAAQQNTSSIAGRRETMRRPARILSMKSGTPGEVLIQTIGISIGGESDGAFRMNVQSGRLLRIAGAPVAGARFITGEGHRVAVASGVNNENKSVVYYLPAKISPGGSTWIRQVTGGSEEGALSPLAWTGKGDEYYAVEDREGVTDGVVIWNAAANTQRLLYRHPAVDMYAASWDPDGRPWLFAGSDHYPVYWYPDPEHPLARMHRELAKGLPQHSVTVTSQTDDLSVAVVRISAGQRPPTFLVMDTRTVKPLQLMPGYPNLKTTDLAPVTAIEFTARDGMKIRGYLTLPRGAEGKPARELPLVVVVHGGPHGISDDSDYDFERQLFAARGYAVLQVNYRGSGGRGREFLRAGYGEWGRKIQDDITDGTRWAMEEGVADPDRMCIYGASFGAYSALVGVSREPTLYKCAVGYAGVYDLPLMFGTGDIQFFHRGVVYLKDAIGENRDDLRARSPVYNAKAIQAKVMLLHGLDDDRAPVEHAKRMRSALIEAGNPPEWLVEDGEGHGFFEPGNRAEAYGRILKFIDGNIRP